MVVEQIIERKMLIKTQERKDPYPIRELLNSIDAYFWTPPAGSPSNLELLREDRER